MTAIGRIHCSAHSDSAALTTTIPAVILQRFILSLLPFCLPRQSATAPLCCSLSAPARPAQMLSHAVRAEILALVALSLFAVTCTASSTGLPVSSPDSLLGASWSNHTLPFFAAASQCAQTATIGREQLFILGGYPTSANAGNEVWHSSDAGASWNEQADLTESFSPKYIGGAAYLANGALLAIGGTQQLGNDVWLSSDLGTTWALQGYAAFSVRQDFGSASMPGSNRVMINGGFTYVGQPGNANNIWINHDGKGLLWTLQCPACYLPYIAGGIVNSETLVALYDNTTWISLGAYVNNPPNNVPSFYAIVSYSTDEGVTWLSYTPPWSPRAAVSAVVDHHNTVYLFGGEVADNILLYDLWFSPNAASSSPQWYQIPAVSGIAPYYSLGRVSTTISSTTAVCS